MQLLACSLDGSIAYFKFTEKELGIIVSEQDKVLLENIKNTFSFFFLLTNFFFFFF